MKQFLIKINQIYLNYNKIIYNLKTFKILIILNHKIYKDKIVYKKIIKPMKNDKIMKINIIPMIKKIIKNNKYIQINKINNNNLPPEIIQYKMQLEQ
jgi:hypothetical protein